MPFVLNAALHPTREAVEEHLVGAYGKNWAEKHLSFEVVEVALVQPDAAVGEARHAALDLFAYMNDLFGRKWDATWGPGAAGSMVAARYSEVRKEGKSHDEAMVICKQVIRWAYRNWWPDPTMKAYCKPDSIFRKTKFHPRRTDK